MKHVFTSPQDAFVYYTECQLATVEELEGLARPPKARLRRHRALAEGMVEHCRLLGYHPTTCSLSAAQTCTRVRDALAEEDEK